MRRCLAAAVVAAALVAGCGGGDGDGGDTAVDDHEEAPVANVSDPGVTLTATAHRDGARVAFDYTLTNPGDAVVGMVDVDVVMDRLEPLDGGAYRVSFLRSTADPAAGAPLPDLRGRALPGGGEVSGTVLATGEFDEVPPEAELCIEVVTERVEAADDVGEGVVTFPYRDPSTPPTLACSGRLPVV